MEARRLVEDVFGERAKGGRLFSFWTHFPEADLDAEHLAEETVALQTQFDLDLVKTSPNGMYAIEDYGVEVDFSDVAKGGVARLVSTPFQSAADWAALQELDMESGALARELQSLRLIRAALPDVPVVFTVFSPMTIAAKLSGGRIYEQIRGGTEPGLIHGALRKISNTVARYSKAAIEAGATGVFFAHQDTGRRLFSHDQFNEYVVPYDLEALTGARHGRFNVLHIHGEDIRFRELVDYPVHALNWHSWEALPSLATGMLTSGKCVVGGIDRRSVSANDIGAIERQIVSAVDAAEGFGELILTPSCTIRAGFHPDTLHAIRTIVKDGPRKSSSPAAA